EVKTMVETIALESRKSEVDQNQFMPTATTPFGRILIHFVMFGSVMLVACLVVLLGMSSEAIGAKTWSYFRLGFEILAASGFLGFLFVVYRAITTKTPEARRAEKSAVPWLIVMVFGIFFGFWSPHLLKPGGGAGISDYIGQRDFPNGDSIEITSVERTKEQMTIKGHYNLVSRDGAELALYITVTNKNAPEGNGEIRPISKGRGDFTLVYLPLVPGLPHVSMYA